MKFLLLLLLSTPSYALEPTDSELQYNNKDLLNIEIDNGVTVYCSVVLDEQCGYKVTGCNDGRVYSCQHHIEFKDAQ